MCGVIGIWANDHIVRDMYQGLLAMQHRGQDAAGIITYDGRFHTKKGNGLVRDIFTAENIQRLRGNIGIGHTRYPTVGGGGGEDAQPFQVNSPVRHRHGPQRERHELQGAQGGALREVPPPAQLRLRRRGHPQRLRPGARRAEDAGPRVRSTSSRRSRASTRRSAGATRSSPTSPSRAWSPSATRSASSRWSTARGTTDSSRPTPSPRRRSA